MPSLTSIADAIAALLTAASAAGVLSQTFTADREFVPNYETEDTALAVFVIGTSATTERACGDLNQVDALVEVGVFKRVDQGDVATVKTLSDFVEEIRNYLTGDDGEVDGYEPVAMDPEPFYDVEVLRSKSVFSSASHFTRRYFVSTDSATPVITVPGAQSATEDVAKSITGTSVAMAGGSTIKTTLTVTHGTLTLAGTSGLTFTAGDGTADATMTFSGSPAATNTAIATLSYIPTGSYVGAALLTVHVERADNAAAYDEKTVAITVVAVPVITVPGTLSGTEDVAKGIAADTLSFADADSSSLTVAMTNDRGAVFHFPITTGLTTVSGANNSAAWTFSGTITNINAAFSDVFQRVTVAMPANENGACVVTVNATDGTNAATPATFTINFAAVNDAPQAASVGNISAASGAFPFALWPSAVLSDVEDSTMEGIVISITGGGQAGDAWDGPTTGGGITVGGNGTGTLTLTGNASLSAYQTKLRAVTFTPDSGALVGTRTVNLFLTGSGVGTPTRSLNVTVDVT